MVAGSMQLILIILDKADGNLRVGQRDLLHQICHMGPLRHGSL